MSYNAPLVLLLSVAYPNTVFFDNKGLIKLRRIMRQDEGEPFDLQLKQRIRPKPKEDNAGMGKL
jgi:hypothetical protein